MPTIVEFPLDATSGLELRVAHRRAIADCDAVRFPNQEFLPVYVERYAFVRGNEFVTARLTGPDADGYFSVEIQLREAAARRIAELAQRSERCGLGAFRRGRPVQLIQAVRGISGGVLAWYGFEMELEARVILDLFGSVGNQAPSSS